MLFWLTTWRRCFTGLWCWLESLLGLDPLGRLARRLGFTQVGADTYLVLRDEGRFTLRRRVDGVWELVGEAFEPWVVRLGDPGGSETVATGDPAFDLAYGWLGSEREVSARFDARLRRRLLGLTSLGWQENVGPVLVGAERQEAHFIGMFDTMLKLVSSLSTPLVERDTDERLVRLAREDPAIGVRVLAGTRIAARAIRVRPGPPAPPRRTIPPVDEDAFEDWVLAARGPLVVASLRTWLRRDPRTLAAILHRHGPRLPEYAALLAVLGHEPHPCFENALAFWLARDPAHRGELMRLLSACSGVRAERALLPWRRSRRRNARRGVLSLLPEASSA